MEWQTLKTILIAVTASYIQLNAKYGIIYRYAFEIILNPHECSSNENAHLIDRIGSNANTLHHDINWRSGVWKFNNITSVTIWPNAGKQIDYDILLKCVVLHEYAFIGIE